MGIRELGQSQHLFVIGHLACVSGKLFQLGNASAVAHMQSVQASNVWCASVAEMRGFASIFEQTALASLSVETRLFFRDWEAQQKICSCM